LRQAETTYFFGYIHLPWMWIEEQFRSFSAPIHRRAAMI
jgi:hypothetical protein